jgi:hypothetical protein
MNNIAMQLQLNFELNLNLIEKKSKIGLRLN